jgi:fumarate hydratase, class I
MNFKYQEMFPLAQDPSEYRLITKEFISTELFDGKNIVKVDPQALTVVGRRSFSRCIPFAETLSS